MDIQQNCFFCRCEVCQNRLFAKICPTKHNQLIINLENEIIEKQKMLEHMKKQKIILEGIKYEYTD